jgi:dTDP-4-amino-4,6-dideoxyglucose formyltransferase
MTKILFLTNNEISKPLENWLAKRVEVRTWENKLTIADMQAIEPDLVVSYSYRHIIGAETLAMLPGKFLNLHISLLPYNRGADPNIWSIVDNTPKGVTIHLMSPGLDEGDIVLSKEVQINEDEHTLRSSYELLHREIQSLFMANWPWLESGAFKSKPQEEGGSAHFSSELSCLRDELLGDEGWEAPISLAKMRYARIKNKRN